MTALHSDSFGDRIDQAAHDLAPFVARHVALAPMTTYRLGGAAALTARPRSLDDLDALATTLSLTGLPVIVVGGGSNLLVADDGFPGIAVVLADLALVDGTGPGAHRTEGTHVVANASSLLPRLARRLVSESLSGFEWAVGVPGSIGGAVRMNAGGHGSDMAACLVDVRLFDLSTGRCGWVPVERLGLRFRGSDLAAQQVVLEARLALSAGDRDRSQSELDEVVRWRRERQPGGQNAGSVFVNPIPGELAAGELIDRVGLRGYVLGTASVSDKHANFIQGSEGGRSADVRALIELVRDRVAAETGFVLRSEVRLVGFADVPDDDSPGVPL
ncbi:MAG: murB [Acidimicrobiales bacterium]|nr:murB [Acidimicrobiales bacterium]